MSIRRALPVSAACFGHVASRAGDAAAEELTIATVNNGDMMLKHSLTADFTAKQVTPSSG